MTTLQIRLGSGATKPLTTMGFTPTGTRKVAGAYQTWTHSDGRTAVVSYGLFSKTYQHSIGSAAVWGYTATITQA